MQELRSTCEHEVWRCRIRVQGIYQGRIKLLWWEWCPRCRQTRQMTFLADVGRFIEFVGWHGVCRQEG